MYHVPGDFMTKNVRHVHFKILIFDGFNRNIIRLSLSIFVDRVFIIY